MNAILLLLCAFQPPQAPPVLDQAPPVAVVNDADVWITVPLTWHCQHCDDWLRTVSLDLQRKGYTVAIKRTDEGEAFPRIWVAGREYNGKQSAAVILAAMKPVSAGSVSLPAGPATGAVSRNTAPVVFDPGEGAHRHQCGSCGTMWQHGGNLPGPVSHRCPTCRRTQTTIHSWLIPRRGR